MRNRRFQRIFGSDNDVEPQALDADARVSNAEPSRITYQQWYDRDPNRFQQECELLEQDGIQFECRKLSDGRLSFLIEIGHESFAVICSHHFPIEPVEVVRMSGLPVPAIVGEDGKVDLFAHDGFEWTTETHIVEVANRVRTLISIADSVKSSKSDRPHDSSSETGQGKMMAKKCTI